MKRPTAITIVAFVACAVPALAGGLANLNPVNSLCIDLRGASTVNSQGACVADDSDCSSEPTPDGVLQCTDNNLAPLDGAICVDQACFQMGELVIVDIELGPTLSPACAAQLFLGWDPSELVFLGYIVDPDGETDAGSGPWMTLLETVDPVAGEFDLAMALPGGVGCDGTSGLLGGATLLRISFQAQSPTCKADGVYFRDVVPPSGVGGAAGSLPINGCNGDALPSAADEFTIRVPAEWTCPESSSGIADCPGTTRTVLFPPITVDSCDPNPPEIGELCTVEYFPLCDEDADCAGLCVGSYCDTPVIPPGVDLDALIDGGGEFLPGRTEVTCNYVDTCGVASGCSFDIENNGLHVPLYVDRDATGTANGADWQDAYANLQHALTNPGVISGTVCEIWVAAGIYTAAPPNGDRDASFEIRPGLKVYGGFLGTETSLEERPLVFNQTILSGDLNGDDGVMGNSENSRHVIKANFTDTFSRIDGFTVIAGNADLPPLDHLGAGFQCINGSLTVANCAFFGNRASFGAGGYLENSAATIVNCIFAANIAAGPLGQGGGLLSTGSSTPTVVNTSMTLNFAGTGGGLYNQAGVVDVANSILWGNSDNGGVGTSAQITVGGGDVNVNYSCIQGGWSGTGGVAIIDQDPLFVNPTSAILKLQPESPCIDEGLDALVTLATDIAGAPRIFGPAVDLGAFEFFPDCNSNGQPDNIDIADETSLDCNMNLIPDECDIAEGTSEDCDTDGIPDECQPSNDTDGDGVADACDDDDDNDGVDDVDDPQTLDPDVCGDTDGDSCDDCVVGTDDFGPLPDNDPNADGVDTDNDGLCNIGDTDDDSDGIADESDPQPQNPGVCGDQDVDLCDDCSIGTDGLGPLPDADVLNDGLDTDADGRCDLSDADDDNDGVADEFDRAALDPSVCGDSDGDQCDDCGIGTDGFGPRDDRDPSNDGLDTDSDGACDVGDGDDDNDGVADEFDPAPLDPGQCGDLDVDQCDDCSIGNDGLGPLPDGDPLHDGLDTDSDGLCDAGDGDDDNDGVTDDLDPADLDPGVCGDADEDGCDDCSAGGDGFGPLPDADPANDGLDTDSDGLCDLGDEDDDNDGVADAPDPQRLDPAICGDVDADTCDDCTVGTDGFGPLADADPLNDGPDTDGDGICDASDGDNDNDGVPDTIDPAEFDPFVCGDLDGDTCDDCSIGVDGLGPLPDSDTANDGPDVDGDGICDVGDGDDDNDGISDDFDPAPGDPSICGDKDQDDCDDCTVGVDGVGPLPDADPLNDGPDTDGDGLCDAGDEDDDNDGVDDGADPQPTDPAQCGDGDADQCDDCAVGTDGFGPLPDGDVMNDGPDFDGDGACDAGDGDDDNDGVADEFDPEPFEPTLCGDLDGDFCDDCSNGVDGLGPLPDQDVSNDGDDTDEDGACDVGDGDDDNDGVADQFDPAPLDPGACGDVDDDLCDDCIVGVDGFGPLRDSDPANDGADLDGDGLCDDGDDDDDNDGVDDGADPAPADPGTCGDVDLDDCDDCTIGTDGFGPLSDVNTADDGDDLDGDGLCDLGDTDDDNDGVSDGVDLDRQNPAVCGDSDGDTCDDCAIGQDGFGPLSDRMIDNDGLDTDADGACDAGDGDDDNDGVADEFDVAALDPMLCSDVDEDECDDCTIGVDGFGPLPDGDVANDGLDTDGDGVCNLTDPCPLNNPDDPDGDGECGVGNQCIGTEDTDHDTIPDICDNCPELQNPNQEDCDDDGIGDVCALAEGSRDCNENGVPDECDLQPLGDSRDCNENGVPSECEADCCIVLADCADVDGDAIRDDGCMWWACVGGICQSVPVVFGDMGGAFGVCPPDGAADGNDRFQVLNCFADINPPNMPGYLCEDDPPLAFNVDTGGAFGSCQPDGVCDGNDAFAALNAFGNETQCTCPLDGGGPAPVVEPVTVDAATLHLAARSKRVVAGRVFEIDVYLDTPLEDLRGYQLHLDAAGGTVGRLELVDIMVRNHAEPGVSRASKGQPNHVFDDVAFWDAYNVATAQMVAGLDDVGIAVERGYLATFIYRATWDARGTFTVELLADDTDGGQRTFLFATQPNARIEIERTAGVVVSVEP